MKAASLSIIATLFVLATGHPAAANDGPMFRHARNRVHILPPQPRPSQRIYAEYQARWWQWATSLPVAGHPLFSDGADGTLGQSGPVWYLGGVFGSGPANRELTVPHGKALFFPVINLAYFLTEPTDTEADARALINTIMDNIVDADTYVEIDGCRVPHLERFRTESRLFNIGPLPADNILGVAAGSVIPTVDDGRYVLLLPLSPGVHTVRFVGHVLVPASVPGVGGYEFSQDATYTLTVERRR